MQDATIRDLAIKIIHALKIRILFASNMSRPKLAKLGEMDFRFWIRENGTS